MKRFFYKVLHKIQPNTSKVLRNLKREDYKELNLWLKTGLKVPPPDIVKWNIIEKYRKKENIKGIIGSGTFFNKRKILFKEKFVYIHNLPLSFSTNTASVNKVDLIKFEELIKKHKSAFIFWIDCNSLFDSKDSISKIEKILKQIIDIIFKTSSNHTILFDNSLLYFESENLPSVHEIKQWLMQAKKGYGNMKTENNIFVFSSKL